MAMDGVSLSEADVSGAGACIWTNCGLTMIREPDYHREPDEPQLEGLKGYGNCRSVIE